jgi:putative endonuclease
MSRQYHVYILTNTHKTVLYTGVTGNLARRIEEHKQHRMPGFTKKYNVDILVYAQAFDSPIEAIAAEKKIKGGSRVKKIQLIESINPSWQEFSV